MSASAVLDHTPPPMKPQHTGDSVRSTTSGQQQAPVLSRRSSVVDARIDTSSIGAAHGTAADTAASALGNGAGAGGRPRMHQRSLTGTYFPSSDAAAAEPWPLGDEQTWRRAMAADQERDEDSVVQHVVHHVTTTLARQPSNLEETAAYQACALAIRDELIRRWNATTSYLTTKAPKRVYYLSLEFLMGRSLDNAVLNLGMKPMVERAMGRLGFSFEDLIDCERDAGLGNGGLGRLAACYMDSSATLNMPMWGYGLRYTYGIFRQLLDSNTLGQVEAIDPWLETENPWEIARNDVKYTVRFYGTVERQGGKGRAIWYGGQEVLAVAYDVPIPGGSTADLFDMARDH